MDTAEQRFAKTKRLAQELLDEGINKKFQKVAQILKDRAELFDQLKSPDEAEVDRCVARAIQNHPNRTDYKILDRVAHVDFCVIATRNGITDAP